MDALGVTMWRSLLAGFAIWVVAKPPVRMPWRTGKLTWGIAITYALTLVMFVSATKLTTAASAIFLQYTAPLYLLFTGAIFLKERATKLDFLTVAVAFCGMALFFVGKLDTDAVTGNVLAAASGVTLAEMLKIIREKS